MSTAPISPTVRQIRESIVVIQVGVRDPDADPVKIATAHRLLVDAHKVAPVRGWLSDYLDNAATSGGAATFRLAVDALARQFKLRAPTPPPAVGEQGQLFR